MKFTLITDDTALAQHAEQNGVGRILVDLEVLGKQERQGHLDTVISGHVMSDVAKIKAAISSAELLVRVNPFNIDSNLEVEQAIAAGADSLMLPMFYHAKEVRQFAEYVDGRVGIIPLVETFSATQCLKDIVTITGVSEIYIGLNDLHLDMELTFMFEPLCSGFVDEMAMIIKSAGLPFGFGGVARIGEGAVPAELIMGEHHRLGSSSVILSRIFHHYDGNNSQTDMNEMQHELAKLHHAVESFKSRSESDIAQDRAVFQAKVKQFVAGH